MMNKITLLRVVGFAEGLSFLILLLIAMPLKYYMDMPMAVTVVGWAHGFLFVAYGATVLYCIRAMCWDATEVVIALGASVVPFGPFFLDGKIKARRREIEAELVAQE